MQLLNKTSYKRSVVLSVLAIGLIVFSGCGGGGSSSSSASGSGNPSSTLVLSNGSSGGIAAVIESQQNYSFSNQVIEQISGLILPSAWASINIFLNNFSYGSKETGETLMIAVTAGSYNLKLEDDVTGAVCTTNLVIRDDEVVSMTIFDITGKNCNVSDIKRDPVDYDLIAGGDNAPAGKTLACHKNKKIAISFNALDAHLAHGDTAGPCTTNQTEVANGKTNKPAKPKKPNKGNKG